VILSSGLTCWLKLFTAPDISNHPAFQPDPFAAKSNSPLLKTTSSPQQIRASPIDVRWNRRTTRNEPIGNLKDRSPTLKLEREILYLGCDRKAQSTVVGSPISKSCKSFQLDGYPRTSTEADMVLEISPSYRTIKHDALSLIRTRGAFRNSCAPGDPPSPHTSRSFSNTSSALPPSSNSPPTDNISDQRLARGISNWFKDKDKPKAGDKGQ